MFFLIGLFKGRKYIFMKRSIKTLVGRAAHVIFVLGIPVLLHAQHIESFNYDVTPASPEAAALFKYEDYQVKSATGVPNISFNLLNLQSRSLSVPVSLSYHASGIKVDEGASMVGLGWSLSYGGMITRQVVGLQDENSDGFKFQGNILVNGNEPTNSQKASYRDGFLDGQPDKWYYSIPSGSGKFMYNNNGDFIEQEITGNTIEEISSGYKITDFNGTKYYFGTTENSKNVTSGSQDVIHPTSWLLDKIVSANNTDSLIFEYYPAQVQDTHYRRSTSQSTVVESEILSDPQNIFYGSGACALNSSTPVQKVSSTSIVWKRYVKKIIGLNEYVAFSYIPRSDINFAWALESISKYSSSDDLISKVNLNTSYFINTTQRLRLDSYDIESPTGEKITTSFNYREDILLPERFSNAQDHWGYYNGALANDVNDKFIPELEYKGTLYSGANREVDSAFNQAYVLKQINYPTGGNVSFKYETNEYFTEVQEATTSQFLINVNQMNQVEQQAFHSAQEQWVDIKIHVYNWDKPIVDAIHDFIDIFLYDGQNNLIDDWRIKPTEEFHYINNIELDHNSDYKIVVENRCKVFSGPYNADIYFDYTSALTWVEKNLLAGGLRIKSIKQNDAKGQTISRNYSYIDASNNRSTGKLITKPIYNQITTKKGRIEIDQLSFGCGTNYAFYICKRLNRYASSFLSLGRLNGAPVVYSNVIETRESGNEKQEVHYNYTTDRDLIVNESYAMYDDPSYPDFSSNDPNTPNWFYYKPIVIDQEYKRGRQLIQSSFEAFGNPNKVQEQTTNFSPYTETNRVYAIELVDGLEFNEFMEHPSSDNCHNPGITAEDIESNTFYHNIYSIKTEYSNLTSSSQQLWSTDYQDAMAASTTSEYSSVIPTFRNKTTYDLTGKNQSQEQLRPFEPLYDDLTETTDEMVIALTEMRARNMLTPTIEEIIYIDDNGVEKAISGQLIKYKLTNGQILPSQVLALETNDPIANFSKSHTNGSGFNYHSQYALRSTFTGYDGIGNITELIDQTGKQVSYLWAYDRLRPVAKIENAGLADVSAALAGADLDSIAEIESSASNSDISSTVAHLQASMPNSFVSGYLYNTTTYQLIETIAPNGVKSTFDYDSFLRLSEVRDDDDYVLSKYLYNHAN